MYRTRKSKRLGALLIVLSLLVSLVPSVFAAETAATMQLTRTEGTVNVVNASGRDVTVREKMRLYGGYAVKTGEKSYAWLALDDTKLVKVDAASEVEVHKNGKSLELLVNAGSLFFNVTEPLEEDETLNICTSSMIAGIRGTVGWVGVKPGRSGVSVLEGRVLCTTYDDSIWVESGRLTSVSAGGEVRDGPLALTDVPGFVLTEVVADPVLCAEVAAASGLKVESMTPEQAAAKLAEDEAQTAVELGKPPDPVPAADTSSDSSGGGGSGPPVTPVEPVEPEEPVEIVKPDLEEPGEAENTDPVGSGETENTDTKEPDETENTDSEGSSETENTTPEGSGETENTNPEGSGETENTNPEGSGETENTDKAVIVGDFTVEGGKLDTDFTYTEPVLTILTATPLTIRNTNKSGYTQNRIAIAETASAAKVTLDGVLINVSDTGDDENPGKAAFLIPDNYSGDVEVDLAEGSQNELRSGYSCAGLQKNSTSSNGSLCITGSGKLTAVGGKDGAGIGGGVFGNGKNINISGNATVEAQGGLDSAGIGGGNGGNGNNITIFNGIVKARGMRYGVGIGGTSCSNISILGGAVEAHGGDWLSSTGAIMFVATGIGSSSGINVKINGHAFVISDGGILEPSLVEKGILFCSGEYGECYTSLMVGDVTLSNDVFTPAFSSLAVPNGCSLTIASGATLTIGSMETLTIDSGGTLINNGTIRLERGIGQLEVNATGTLQQNGVIEDKDGNPINLNEMPVENAEEFVPEVPAEISEPEDNDNPVYGREPVIAAEPGTYLAGFTASAGPPYQDVPPNAWYAGAVAYCQENSLMTGTDATHFTPKGALTQSMTASWDEGAGIGYPGDTPDQTVTREELAVLLWQKAGSPESVSALPFADADLLSENAVQAAAWANETGLMTGKPGGILDPLAVVTRAEAATILMRRDLAAAAPAMAVGTSVTDASLGANGITAAEDGSLLVTDLYNKKIWRVSEGRASVYAGGDTAKDPYGRPHGGNRDAELLESYFSEPWAIAPYQDGWAVTDAANNALRLLSGGKVQTISKGLSHPTGLAADGAGNLYIADTFNGTIRKMDEKRNLTVAASGLSDPMGLCWKNGVLYIAETGANRVSKLDGANVVAVAGNGEDGSADGSAETASFSAPSAVTVADDGTVYVSDTGNSAIRRIRNGKVDTIAARDYSAGDLRLIEPSGLMLQGNVLLVCDSFARTILSFPVD